MNCSRTLGSSTQMRLQEAQTVGSEAQAPKGMSLVQLPASSPVPPLLVPAEDEEAVALSPLELPAALARPVPEPDDVTPLAAPVPCEDAPLLVCPVLWVPLWPVADAPVLREPPVLAEVLLEQAARARAVTSANRTAGTRELIAGAVRRVQFYMQAPPTQLCPPSQAM